MRSQLGPSLANRFWHHHKQNWLDKWEYISLYYQHIFMIFVLIPSSPQLKRS